MHAKMKANLQLCLLLLISVFCSPSCAAETLPCRLRETSHGSVCVCTSSYCDYVEMPLLNNGQQIVVISSSQNGLRFKSTDASFDGQDKFVIEDERSTAKSFIAEAIIVEQNRAWLQLATRPALLALNGSVKTVKISVDRSKHYQEISNFGGALTGSVSHILKQLPTDLQDHIYKSYFHSQGIGYNTVRTSIGGCDFDLEPWAYNEQPQNDAQLSNFSSLDARDLLKVEQLQRLKTVASLPALKIMAAAWSAPPWMKTNGRWTGFGQLKLQYYDTWAQYHLKFLDLMEANGMPIWAISTGNEPLNGIIGFFFVHFMSMGWTPRQQAIWLGEHLGPTIRNSAHSQVKIFGNDDQRYTYPGWFRKMRRSRRNSVDYLDGLAVHWYWDDIFGPELIDEIHNEMPNKLLLNTESCLGDKPWQTHGPELGSWERGEHYMRAYLQDLQHNFNGWLDWNLVLDEQGGPNYSHNYVDSPIIVNTTNRAEFYKQPMFYAIGHFSKFLPEKSKRIETSVSGSELTAVGFERPDGNIAVILYNGENAPLDVHFQDTRRGELTMRIPPRSWHTVLYT
ncbi:lysosomal acid glucosylceramidase [Scaptodrosophila lebanonensis]|uniref:Glucosylceramidase n=1 Tax=Drosophila lebanonensis TaxID=7225 RepID=A0A6J2T6Z4_DROLE|nr:lysosomal acid glucosylceramidase [Scaptodrosophila lebanonensis]